jgi:hypothetical protein
MIGKPYPVKVNARGAMDIADYVMSDGSIQTLTIDEKDKLIAEAVGCQFDRTGEYRCDRQPCMLCHGAR